MCLNTSNKCQVRRLKAIGAGIELREGDETAEQFRG